MRLIYNGSALAFSRSIYLNPCPFQNTAVDGLMVGEADVRFVIDSVTHSLVIANVLRIPNHV